MNLLRANDLRRRSSLILLAVIWCGCFRSAEQKHSELMDSGREYARSGDHARAVLQFKNALQELSDDPEAHYELAQALLATNSPVEAVQALLRATELDPRHARAQLALAQLMIGAGRERLASQAVDRLEVVLNEAPNDGDAHFVMAAARMRMGSAEEAERHLRESLRNAPEHLRSSVALATIRLGKNDFDGAEAVIKSAVERSADSPDPVLALGHLYTLMNRTKEAEQQFERALEIAPEHVPSMLALAGFYLRQDRESEAEDLYRKVSEISDRHRTIHAQFLIRVGQEENASRILEKLWRAEPKDRNARSLLVATQLADGRRGDAKRVLDSVLAENPDDLHALLQRGYVRLLEEDIASAEKDLSDVVRNEPNWAVAHQLLSRVHRANGVFQLQKQELEKALELEPSNLSVRLELARFFIAAGPAQSALDLLDLMPEEQKAVLPTVVTRNWALIATNGWAAARQSIDRGLAMERTPELVLQDGIARFYRGDIDGARSSFVETLEVDPGEVRAMVGLAQSYLAQDQPSAADEHFRRYAARSPNSPQAQRLLGDWLVKNGDLAGARKAYEAAIAGEAPESIETRLKLARLSITEKQYEQAREGLIYILTVDEASPTPRLLLGIAEEGLANHGEARRHYQQVVQDDPTNVIALNNLAFRLATDGEDLNQALSHAQRAKELAPENPSVSDTLGWIYYLKGLYEAALPHLEEAASRLDGEPSVHSHLAMAYFQAGEWGRATEALQKAEALDPHSPEARSARVLIMKGPVPALAQ